MMSLLTSVARAHWSLTLALPAFATLLHAAEPEKGTLVIVGGGTTPSGLHRKLLDLAGGTNANVLVVPLASSSTNNGAPSVEMFLQAGAVHVSTIPTNDAKSAQAAVRAADVIWMPGGEQTRLMAELNRFGVVAAIRERYAKGAMIGGTSAGAAVMSKVMITGTGDAKEGKVAPPLGEGLGLWPGVIVDQHFVKRGREPRLRAAIRTHPDLLGVGIDESTYVLVKGNGFEVDGKSTVLVLDARGGGEMKRTELKAGGKFDLDRK
jgi:cyanophycinase